MNIKNRNVLITGGASGIGKIMGRIALERGANSLIIWDINEQNIASTVKEFEAKGKVKGYRVDVGDIEAVRNVYATTVKECGDIDLLINNAGIITGNRTFDQVNIEEIDRTMRINAVAPMYVARIILPDMLRRGVGHICNITSAGGMLGNPRMAVYGASKWAAIGWSDSVRIELQEQKSPVHVTTVTPYYINTGMFDGVKSPIIPILNPERTAKKIIRAVEKNRIFRGIPFGLHFIRFWQFALPIPVFDFFFGKVFGIYHTMDNFVGRK
jgi:short-subunit dehydrogenase